MQEKSTLNRIVSDTKAATMVILEALFTPKIGVIPALRDALFAPVTTVAGAIIGAIHVIILLLLLIVGGVLLGITPFYWAIYNSIERLRGG